ncbi:MAG: hypothetical protein CVV34_03945 [Methanomicrobiales archaeon HGW-Methanomicrobiales-5]|nr:MAG: hypothetical protein CVV34_03945 [Methanomicrobiales archaeon HGW-Methanomicrobiales-5]
MWGESFFEASVGVFFDNEKSSHQGHSRGTAGLITGFVKVHMVVKAAAGRPFFVGGTLSQKGLWGHQPPSSFSIFFN